MKMKLLILFYVMSLNINANLPNYSRPVLIARTNTSTSYNLPINSILNDVSTAINNKGDITFNVLSVDEEKHQGIFVKEFNKKEGEIVFNSPDDYFLSGPAINDEGKIVFSMFDEDRTEGIYLYSIESKKAEKVEGLIDRNLRYYTYPIITNKNEIFFRGTDEDNNRGLFRFNGELNKIISEGKNSENIKSSYFFRPAVNNFGSIALKVRLGEKGSWDEKNPDILAFLEYGKLENPRFNIVAVDKDANEKSNYISFFNQVALSNQNQLVFASTLDDGRTSIFMADKKSEFPVKIATEGVGDLSNIEFFPIRVNSKGLILFRGKDKNLKRSLFLSDGKKLKKILSEGDIVDTDLGPGMILDNQMFPGFSGEVDINDLGQIVFTAVVVKADSKGTELRPTSRALREEVEWGQAVFLLNPEDENAL
jgi:hypothetical protein